MLIDVEIFDSESEDDAANKAGVYLDSMLDGNNIISAEGEIVIKEVSPES